MSEISEFASEYISIKEEITMNNKRNSILRKRLADVELYIKDYITEHNHPGVRYKGQDILLDTTKRKIVKRKQERKDSITEYLSSIGVSNAESVYEQLEKVQRTDNDGEAKLRIK